MIICQKHKIVFIAVPKTGTRTIYKVLEEQYDGRRQVDHQISVPGVNRNFFTFIIKRNPYDRICSVYWALCRRNPKSDAYGWIKSLNERGLANNLENFLLIVKSGKKHRVNHPIPQYKYYRGNRIDRVLRFENLQEDFNQLPFVKGPFELPHANRTVGIKSTPKKVRIPRPSWKEIVNDRSIQLINQIYERDFKLLGYEMIK